MTSFDVVAYLRRLLGVRKVGHCGTLDPYAVGVLPVCLGHAAGVAGFLTAMRKSYRVEAVAGIRTDTLDFTGALLERSDEKMPDRQAFETVLRSFEGAQTQTPPMHSAVKVGGKRLYRFAQKGVEVERPAREIVIDAIRLIRLNENRAIFDVDCSKGTYIRVLCQDIGRRAGISLCMSFLVRTASAGLRLEDALTLEQIERDYADHTLESRLIGSDALLSGYPAVALSREQYERFINGADVVPDEEPDAAAPQDELEAVTPQGELDFAVLRGGAGEALAQDEPPLFRVYYIGRFLGLGQTVTRPEGVTALRVRKFLADRQDQI